MDYTSAFNACMSLSLLLRNSRIPAVGLRIEMALDSAYFKYRPAQIRQLDAIKLTMMTTFCA